ncbi:hypothetical protein HBB16_07720 [Pseudonocardia sp. MCCB 268]|nr:hypothetical protein [Pseudonocardia cytotoxica]
MHLVLVRSDTANYLAPYDVAGRHLAQSLARRQHLPDLRRLRPDQRPGHPLGTNLFTRASSPRWRRSRPGQHCSRRLRSPARRRPRPGRRSARCGSPSPATGARSPTCSPTSAPTGISWPLRTLATSPTCTCPQGQPGDSATTGSTDHLPPGPLGRDLPAVLGLQRRRGPDRTVHRADHRPDTHIGITGRTHPGEATRTATEATDDRDRAIARPGPPGDRNTDRVA